MLSYAFKYLDPVTFSSHFHCHRAEVFNQSAHVKLCAMTTTTTTTTMTKQSSGFHF